MTSNDPLLTSYNNKLLFKITIEKGSLLISLLFVHISQLSAYIIVKSLLILHFDIRCGWNDL